MTPDEYVAVDSQLSTCEAMSDTLVSHADPPAVRSQGTTTAMVSDETAAARTSIKFHTWL